MRRIGGASGLPEESSVARISDAVRDAIASDLRRTLGTPEGSTRRVAARHGVSDATVRRIATASALDAGESRARTRNATEQLILTNAQRRERLAQRLLDMAERALDDMTAPATVFNFGGKDNTYNERTLERPPTADLRNLAIIAGVGIDKHKILEHFDSAAQAGQQADLLLKLLTGRADS